MGGARRRPRPRARARARRPHHRAPRHALRRRRGHRFAHRHRPRRGTQAARFDARDALDLPKKQTISSARSPRPGSPPRASSRALEAMRHAARKETRLDDVASLRRRDPGHALPRRGRGRSPRRVLPPAPAPRPAPPSASRPRCAPPIPARMLTGYSRLESALRETLRHDMPRIGLVAMVLVGLALAASLRKPRDIAIAALVVAAEVAAVLILIRVLKIPLHAYDALVLPVCSGSPSTKACSSSITPARRPRRRHPRHDPPRGPVDRRDRADHRRRFRRAGFLRLRRTARPRLRGRARQHRGLIVALIVVPAGLRLSRPKKNDLIVARSARR